MKTKMTVMMGVLVAGLLVASAVFAKGESADGTDTLGTKAAAGEKQSTGAREFCPRDGRMGRGAWRDGRHHQGMRGLNLTEAQRTKLDKIDAASQKDVEPIHKEIDGLHERMHQEWRAAKPNKSNIMSLHRKMRGLNDRLAERRISDRLERIALLTPEQRAEMIERIPEKPARDGRGFRDGHGRGFKDGRGRGFKDGRGFRDGRGPGACDGSGNRYRRQSDKASSRQPNK